jgi:RNA polymerase sigma-70 factor (ECF subfamily)
MSRQIPDASDEELVQSARRGDTAAFDELVRRFRGAVIAVAEQTTGSRDCAEDVAQDAFLQAFRALPQLQDPQKFGHWLYVIARCRARRLAARGGRCLPTDPGQMEALLHAHGDAPSCHPIDEMIRAAEHAAVRTAFSQLPKEHAAVLQLYYFEGWPVKRIANHLFLSTTTVKWRLHRGRRLMQLLLSRKAESGVLALEASEHPQIRAVLLLFPQNICLPPWRSHLRREVRPIHYAPRRLLSRSRQKSGGQSPVSGSAFTAAVSAPRSRSPAARRRTPCGSSSVTPAPTHGCISLT